jgi:hypothetical protein
MRALGLAWPAQALVVELVHPAAGLVAAQGQVWALEAEAVREHREAALVLALDPARVLERRGQELESVPGLKPVAAVHFQAQAVDRLGLALERDQVRLVLAAQEQPDRAPEGSSAVVALRPAAQVPPLERAAVPEQELAALEAAAQGPARVLVRLQVRAPIQAGNQGAVCCSEGQADPGVEGRAEADREASGQAGPEGWAQAAAKDQATREATSRPGPPRTKTSWEF